MAAEAAGVEAAAEVGVAAAQEWVAAVAVALAAECLVHPHRWVALPRSVGLPRWHRGRPVACHVRGVDRRGHQPAFRGHRPARGRVLRGRRRALVPAAGPDR